MFIDPKSVKNLIKYMIYCELFLEDIPQIIIQSINNSMTKTWNLLEYISLGFSGLMLLVGIADFLFSKKEKD